jgi:hypothetical protein
MINALKAKGLADSYHAKISSDKFLPVVLEMVEWMANEGAYEISDMYKQLFHKIEEEELESQTVKELEKKLKNLGFTLTEHPDDERNTYTTISWR